MKTCTAKRSPYFHCANLLDSGLWNAAEIIGIDQHRPESGEFIPKAEVRLLWCEQGILGRFRVEDRYVRCMTTGFQDHVCSDSCVEFFVMPAGNRGYVNFEFSGGGVLHTSHITDWTRTADGFGARHKLTEAEAEGIVCASTLPRNIAEIADQVTWELGFFVPFTVFEKLGFKPPVSGDVWTCNFYKCGDDTRYPHWLAWNPVDELNFHLPRCFGELRFE
ncbi:MAG: carbohydrate-binding family 9-like protein [Victivallaceae bacterium]